MSSNNTDRRVVEMYFDNKDFEKNARESIRTMGELNDSLNMTSSAKNMNKSLSEVNSNTSILAATTATLGKQWSAWEVVAITAIQRVTNYVIDLGERMIKSLSVDQISSGWEKFGELTKNTATLIAQGLGTEEVDANLKKLLWFADATSYSFTDMTNNISKFTAAGQSLDDSTTAIMGIANWAALAGQNASTASRAMYQISQAMSTGTMRYQDWKSIQNANMDTVQFREQAVKAAIEAGQLYKEADDTYRTLEGKEYSLSQLFSSDGLGDLWFNSEVMMKTFSAFSTAVEGSYAIVQESGVSAYEAIKQYAGQVSDMTDEDAKATAKFGVTAFKAAQECRTFADAVNAIKDAVSSEFMKSFKTIFGTLEEAKRLWGDVYDSLEKIFLSGAGLRNKALSLWKDLGGRDDLFANTEDNIGALFQMLDSVNQILQTFRQSFYEVFLGIDITSENASEQLSKKFKQISEAMKRVSQAINKYIVKHSGTIKNIIKTVFNGIKMIVNIVRIGISLVKSVVTGLKPLLGLLGGGSGGLLKITEKINDRLEKFINTSKVFEKITNTLTKVTTKLVAKIKEFNIIEHIQSGFDKFKTALANNGKTVESLKRIWAGLKVVFTSIGNYILKILPKVTSVLGKGLSKGLNYLAQGIGYLADKFAEAVEAFNKWRTKPQTVERWGKITAFISKQFKSLGNVLKSMGSRVIELAHKINWKKIQNVLSGIWKVVRKLTKTVYNFGKTLIQSGLSKAMQVISKAFTDTKDAITETGDSLNSKATTKYTKFVAKIKKAFGPLIDMFKSFKNLVMALARVLTQLFTLITKALNAIADKLSKIPNIFNNKKIQEIFGKFKSMNTVKQIAIVAGLILIVKILRDALSVLTIASAISDSIFALSKFLRAKAFYMVAAGIKMIITSLIAITAAIAVLGKIKTEVVRNGINHMAEIAGLMTLFIGTLLLLLKVFGDKSVLKSEHKLTLFGKAFNREGYSEYTAMSQMARTVSALAAAMTSIAIALSLMVIPIKMLGKMDDNMFATGMERVTKIVALLSIYTVILARSAKTKKDKTEIDTYFIKRISKSLTALVAAIVAMSYTINKVGKLNEDNFKNGFGRIATVLTLIAGYQLALSLFTKTTAKSKNGKYLKKESNAEAINAISKNLLMTSIAMVGLIYAVKQFATLDKKSYIKGIGAIGAALAGFVTLSILLSVLSKFISAKKTVETISTKKSIISALSDIGVLLVGIGTALLGVSLGLYIISKLGKDQLVRSAKVLGAVLGGLLIITGLISLYNKKSAFSSKSEVKRETMKITAIIAAIASLASVFVMMSFMSNSQLKKASIAMGVVAGALGATLLVVSIINKLNYGKSVSTNMLKKNTKMIYMIMTIAGAISLLAVSMRSLGKSSNKDLIRGGVAMLAIIGILSAALALFKVINLIPGDISSKSIIALVAITASITLLAMAFTQLGKMSWKAIGKGATVMLILTAAVALLSGLGAALSGGAVGIAAIAGVIAAIGVALLSFAYALQVLDSVDTDRITKNLDEILSYFRDNWTTIIAGVTAMSAAIVGGILGAILGAIPAIVTALGEMLAAIFQWLADNGGDLAKNFCKFLADAFSAIADNFGPIGESLLKIFKKIVYFITHDVAFTLGKTLITAGADFIKYFLKGMWEGISETFNIGQNIVKGIKNGIKSMWNDLKKTVKDLAKDYILGPIKNVLHINSPSRAMAEIGAFTIEGLNNGIEKEADKTDDVMSDVAKSIVGSIDDTNLTLTPVIDLSEIQNGTSQMARMMNSVNGASVSATMASNTMSSVESSRAANIRAAQQTQIQPAGNENITLNNTFNITGEADPNEIADTVSKKIAEQITRRKTAWQ